MKLRTIVTAGTALLVVFISGCAGTPELDENWGRSFEEARVVQTLNPEGSGNLEPVEGLPGPIVEKISNDRLQEQDKQ